MKLKKAICILLCLLLTLCAGCSQGKQEVPPQEAPPEVSSPPEEAQTPPEEESTPDEYTPPALTLEEEALLAAPALSLPTVEAGRLTEAGLTDTAAPAQERPVIFIADGGTGDGSSPDAPLRLEESGNVCISEGTEASRTGFYDSLLYQAAARLYGTGGTIVLVGEVLCDGDDGIGENASKELRLPHLGGASVTITSVYDGVDYRQSNGARLILQSPVCLALNNPVTFRDIDLCTQSGSGFAGSNRTICGDGFPLVIDEGVRCIALDASGAAISEPSADLYPSLAGGHRLNSLERSTSLTVRSGTFYTVTGGCLGIGIGGYGDLHGSTQVVIEGSARILGILSAASPDSRALQDGDATLIIRGGTIQNKVQISGAGGFSGPNAVGRIIISGGEFAQSVKLMAKAGNSYFGHKAGRTLLDCSAYTGESDLSAMAVGFSQVAVNGGSVALAASPTRQVYFTGDCLDLTGLSLTVTLDGKEKPLDYDPSISGFRLRVSGEDALLAPEELRLTQETGDVELLYCGQSLGTLELTVLDRPAISIVGVSVLPGEEAQSLGFLFGVESGEYPALSIRDAGVLALPTALLRRVSDLTQGTMSGYAELAYGEPPAALAATCGETEGLLYAAVTDIPVEEYTEAYTAVAYYSFVYDGAVYTAYSQPCTASVYSAALQSGGAPEVVALAESGGHSTYSQQAVDEKVEAMLSYFEQMATVAWTSPEEINFSGSSVVTGALQYQAGKVYYGLPYIGGYNGIDNLENFQGQLDESGLYIGSTAWNAMHGNNCTTAVFQAISRVSNNYDYWAEVGDPVLNIIPKMDNSSAPTVKVGSYTIKPTSALTRLIVQENDPQAIYEAYAAAHRGDYLLTHWLSGSNLLSHLRLITGIHVERSADGRIDPYTSYLLIHEQTSTMDQQAATSWGLNRQFFFAQLAAEGYLPTRDAAFETGYFETPHCVVYDINTAENITDGVRGQVVSNYDLSEVRLTVVRSDTGETVFEAADYCFLNRTCSLNILDPDNQVAALAGTGSYTYILQVTTANETRELIRFQF